MLESTLLSVHLEGNLGLEIDLSIIHTSFEPFPQDTLRDSVAEVGDSGRKTKVFAGLGTKYRRSFHFNYMEIYLKSVAFTFTK